MEILQEKLKTLPDSPGVYIMKDKNGEIIYIGKAKVLKNRVRQYFHDSYKTDKVMMMVSKIFDFSYIITNNEKEALGLEANLIKKHKPFYNILLKDDKSYPYIRVDLKEKYPSFSITRRVKSDKCRYFGPLMAGVRAKDILDTLAICFKARLCKLNMNKVSKNHRACLNYHIERCDGLCMNYGNEEKYKKNVADAISFLQGNISSATDILTQKMLQASENQDFERAIDYRTRIEMLTKLKDKVITNLNKDIDLDVFAYACNDTHGGISQLIIRGGKIVASENFMLSSLHLSKEEVFSGFLTQYYKEGIMLPDQIALPIEAGEELREYLSEKFKKRVNIVCPKQGTLKELSKMCENNALDYIEKAVDKESKKLADTVGACEALAKYIGYSGKISRMECYDISNISGTDKVASMVVFIDGEKAVKHYRRFKIQTVEGSNDFACMQEVLSRRFAHLSVIDEKDISFSSKPDLVVVDGGKGQLSSSVEALQNTRADIALISLAKREEEVFLPGNQMPVIIPKSSVALKLLQRIRDEAHRFAITYHRSLRQNHMLTSALDSIEGIGKNKRRELLLRFKTLQRIKLASVEDIATVNGIGETLAKKIKESLIKDEI